ncbi:MAG: glycosyltransferase family 4 protein [Lachnospiraceae bacterium]|nr:glycosyltransferase family 4 protein [Lachnospiraceae bacterium]
MKITFLSNYINHHQLPFCDALFTLIGEGFTFIQTTPMEEERLKMGWDMEGEKRGYIRLYYAEKENVITLISGCDVLLAGWYEDKEIDNAVQKRISADKPTFKISERIYREGKWRAISPRGLIHKYFEFTRHRKRKYYLLCAGSYVASDFSLIKAFPDKKYRWGYFPVMIEYDEKLWQNKKAEPTVQICWCARFIPLKHPEDMIKLADDLRKAGVSFHLQMIGSGEMDEEIKELAAEKNLLDIITFHGALTPGRVREIMEKCHIFAFTSDYREGWGTVMNEAMNSGLAVVGSAQAGGSEYLIRHGENGFIYHNYEDMRDTMFKLVSDVKLCEEIGRNAYRTIVELWNAEKAAGEFVRICRDILAGSDIVPAEEGPLSVV